MFFSSRLATKINMEVTNNRGMGIVNDETKTGIQICNRSRVRVTPLRVRAN